ncbi:MAG: C45 family peptidase [Planctomycetota bacterium]
MFLKRRRRNLVPVVLAAAIIGLAGVGTTGCSYISILRNRARIRSGLLTPRRHDPARLDVRGNIPVLHLYGTPKEMGTQYGTILREPLRAFDAYIRAILPDARLERLLAFAAEHEPTLPREVRDELRAIADAAEVPYMDLVAMNVLPRMMCTCLAVSGDASEGGSLIMGRNADYFGFGLEDRGSMIVVYHPSKGVPVVAISFIGMVGAFTGVNGEGVAFGNLLIFNARDDDIVRGGLPIQITMRLAAHRSGSARAMSAILRSQQHMAPMNVMAADGKEAILLELGLNASHVRLARNGVLAASNHFRTPELRAREVACERYATLIAAAEKNHGAFDVELMKKTLHAARIRGLNLQAAVFEPAAMTMHVSVNRSPAAAGPYAAFDVKKLCADE